MTYEIAIGFGIVLAIIHFFSDKIERVFGRKRLQFVSFSAGISTAYLFLVLLPEVYARLPVLNGWLFVCILLGFTVFHLIEKFVYTHTLPVNELKHQLKEIHSVTFFVYHVLLGIVLAELSQQNIYEGVLLFIPVLFHTAISTVSLEQLHDKIKYHLPARVLLSISTLLGLVLATWMNIPIIIQGGLLAFVAGALFFIIIREYIPPEREGSTRVYLLALIGYSIFVLILNAKQLLG